MSIASRLQKVASGLTPLERALLVLRAGRDGREAEAGVREVADAQERRLFSRYMALAYVINRELGAVSRVIAEGVTTVEQANNYRRLFGLAAGTAEEHDGLKRPVRAPADWRALPRVTLPQLLRGLEKEMRDDAFTGLSYRWRELLALEILREELALEFAGEDPTLSELAQEMAETRRRLTELARDLGVKDLPEQDEEMLDQYRRFVDGSFKQLGVVGVYL